ncbi:GDSL-type esterase/lipase family protein [Mucilaginibacter sp. PAMB04168]|uniref:GDSL-type esterase/lipase family protein n=1 Tax=Mucilaginibacter sp. PAMB04168 TaxID=3138567 RepID=UPI0031F68761
MRQVIGFKFLTTGLLAFCLAYAAFAQEVKIDSNYINSHYTERMDFFHALPVQKHAIVFLGNSITEHGEWPELVAGKKPVINRGIGGDNTFGLRARLNEVLADEPSKIFLLIGINDLFRKLPYEVTVSNYKRIISAVRTKSPKTKLYIQSVLPINEDMLKQPYAAGRNAMVLELNKRIEALATTEKIPFINLHPLFLDAEGKLKRELTLDGVHLKPKAYVTWIEYLKSSHYL